MIQKVRSAFKNKVSTRCNINIEPSCTTIRGDVNNTWIIRTSPLISSGYSNRIDLRTKCSSPRAEFAYHLRDAEEFFRVTDTKRCVDVCNRSLGTLDVRIRYCAIAHGSIANTEQLLGGPGLNNGSELFGIINSETPKT